MAPDANLAGVVIDDDAIDELGSELDRARRYGREKGMGSTVERREEGYGSQGIDWM